MANKDTALERATVGAWAKRCFFAGRALMEEALRPHDLGATQWYILHQLAQVGPTMQRVLITRPWIEWEFGQLRRLRFFIEIVLGRISRLRNSSPTAGVNILWALDD